MGGSKGGVGRIWKWPFEFTSIEVGTEQPNDDGTVASSPPLIISERSKAKQTKE